MKNETYKWKNCNILVKRGRKLHFSYGLNSWKNTKTRHLKFKLKFQISKWKSKVLGWKYLPKCFVRLFPRKNPLKYCHSNFWKSTMVKKEYFLTIQNPKHDLFVMIVAHLLSQSWSIQRRHITIVAEVGRMRRPEREGIATVGPPIVITNEISGPTLCKHGTSTLKREGSHTCTRYIR